MNSSDARWFGFCIRCLEYPNATNILTEHHTEGRNVHRNQLVFICRNGHVEINRIQLQDRSAYDHENDAMLEKTRMLVLSRSLRFVIEHRDRVADGFAIRNRNAPDVQVGPKGIEFWGPLGAVGTTGKRYYFLPVPNNSNDDDTVDVYDTPDGIGGVGGIGPTTGGWIRFRGKGGGILASFIEAHRKHAGLANQLVTIKQD